jgi:hypothetical protein
MVPNRIDCVPGTLWNSLPGTLPRKLNGISKSYCETGELLGETAYWAGKQHGADRVCTNGNQLVTYWWWHGSRVSEDEFNRRIITEPEGRNWKGTGDGRANLPIQQALVPGPAVSGIDLQRMSNLTFMRSVPDPRSFYAVTKARGCSTGSQPVKKHRQDACATRARPRAFAAPFAFSPGSR